VWNRPVSVDYSQKRPAQLQLKTARGGKKKRPHEWRREVNKILIVTQITKEEKITQKEILKRKI